MNKHFQLILTGILLLLLCLSPGVSAAKSAAVNPAWTIPEYGEKAWNLYSGEMAAFDTSSPDKLNLNGTAALLMEASSGRVLYELDRGGLRYPASVTKLMTLIVTLDAVNNGEIALTDLVTYSPAAVAEDGSKSGHLAGDTDTLEQSLSLIMVISCNDTAYAIAERVCGSVDAFVKRMNDKAAALGLVNTVYCNPNGLHNDAHYTTAEDLAKLAQYCLQREDVMKYVSLREVTMPNGKIGYNSNKLLFWLEGTTGLKTGRTVAAGNNLVATATRNGMTLIAVVLSCKDYYNYIDAAKLLEYGFANYSMKTVVEKGSSRGTVPAYKTREKEAEVKAGEDISYPMAASETDIPDIVVDSPGVVGQCDEGTDVGDIVVTLNGEEIGRCDLVTAEKIHSRSIFGWLKDLFLSVIGSF